MWLPYNVAAPYLGNMCGLTVLDKELFCRWKILIFFSTQTNVVGTHQKRFAEALLMSSHQGSGKPEK